MSVIQEIFHKNSQLYIYIVSANIRNIYVKYSHCGPIHFKLILNIFFKQYLVSKSLLDINYRRLAPKIVIKTVKDM